MATDSRPLEDNKKTILYRQRAVSLYAAAIPRLQFSSLLPGKLAPNALNFNRYCRVGEYARRSHLSMYARLRAVHQHLLHPDSGNAKVSLCVCTMHLNTVVSDLLTIIAVIPGR